MREVLETRLTAWGFDVSLAESGRAARAVAEDVAPDVVLSDVVLPDISGQELLQLIPSNGTTPPPVTILMTAYGTIDSAVDAMKRGAWDFLTKPIDYPKLRATLASAEDDLALRRATRHLEAGLAGGPGLGALVGDSEQMREVYRLISTVAPKDAPAIITGETGTGKEFVARTIHELSQVRGGPFLAVNTSAIPEGLAESELFGHERGAFTGAVETRRGCFELADRGTLFLDEIADMPVGLQPKFLRVLEEGQVRRVGGSREVSVRVRVIAATNRDPVAALDQGLLREDLYYRLNVFTVLLPPLRERTGDIPLLAQHFIRELNGKHRTQVEGVTSDTQTLLQAAYWPGNVRELRNVIERAVILAHQGWLEPVHLPPSLREPGAARPPKILISPTATTAEAERVLILETLKRLGNNKSRAARQLGLDVKTLRSKLKSYALGGDREDRH